MEIDVASSLDRLIASSPVAMARLDRSGTVLQHNAAFSALCGRTTTDWPLTDCLNEDDNAALSQLLKNTLTFSDPTTPIELTLQDSSDEDAPGATVQIYLSRIQSEDDTHNSAPVIMAQLIDLTGQKNLELQFAHSQRMQAVGQLAGGVAHDFNNLLTAMIGFCDLLLMRHPAGDQSFADIMQIKQNANRAANLVRQLLAFSRRQVLQPEMLNITDVLAELSNLIRRLIGENIELKVIHGRDIGMVRADQGQLEQVFINLAVNARDAMAGGGGGGTLTIKSSIYTVDRLHPLSRNLTPPAEDERIADGEYVLVQIADTGHGIPKNMVQQVFEPFFSTKEVGSGTGLGLATVYGIIKQTGGYIYVTSEEENGTTFSLFFPRHAEEISVQEPETQPEEPLRERDLTGVSTILLVEDETPVRIFSARALRNKGYNVIEADSGESALEMIEEHGDAVEIIVTDVIMPGMNGPDMVEQVRKTYPSIKVIFISGYAEDVFKETYGSDRAFNFLPKPFTLKQLASKVKEVSQTRAAA